MGIAGIKNELRWGTLETSFEALAAERRKTFAQACELVDVAIVADTQLADRVNWLRGHVHLLQSNDAFLAAQGARDILERVTLLLREAEVDLRRPAENWLAQFRTFTQVFDEVKQKWDDALAQHLTQARPDEALLTEVTGLLDSLADLPRGGLPELSASVGNFASSQSRCKEAVKTLKDFLDAYNVSRAQQ